MLLFKYILRFIGLKNMIMIVGTKNGPFTARVALLWNALLPRNLPRALNFFCIFEKLNNFNFWKNDRLISKE